MWLSQLQSPLQSPKGQRQQVPKQELAPHSVASVVVPLSVAPFDYAQFSCELGDWLLAVSPHRMVCLCSVKTRAQAQQVMAGLPLPQLACRYWNTPPDQSTCGVHICRE